MKKIITLLLFVFTLNCSAQRIETQVFLSGIVDSTIIDLCFYIHNDSPDTVFLGSLLTAQSIALWRIDSGYYPVIDTPLIADTSLHPLIKPYVLLNKGIFQFVYNFKTGNRLKCSPFTLTAIGSCHIATRSMNIFQVIYADVSVVYNPSNSASFFATSTTQSSNLKYDNSWWKFFNTYP